MSYTPTKGSPMPAVPGNNAIEAALAKVEGIVNNIPLDPATKAAVQEVESILQLGIQAIDPYAQKGAERSLLLDTAWAKGTDGIPDLITFATDQPAHPTPWVRKARWMCVQLGAPDPLPNGP